MASCAVVWMVSICERNKVDVMYIYCPNDPERVFGTHTWIATWQGRLGDEHLPTHCKKCGAALTQRASPSFQPVYIESDEPRF